MAIFQYNQLMDSQLLYGNCLLLTRKMFLVICLWLYMIFINPWTPHLHTNSILVFNNFTRRDPACNVLLFQDTCTHLNPEDCWMKNVQWASHNPIEGRCPLRGSNLHPSDDKPTLYLWTRLPPKP